MLQVKQGLETFLILSFIFMDTVVAEISTWTSSCRECSVMSEEEVIVIKLFTEWIV